MRRSEWKGHVTLPKGGRERQVNMTKRLEAVLTKSRHLRGDRVLWRDDRWATPPFDSGPLRGPTLRANGSGVTAVLLAKWMRRAQRRAGLKVTGGLHILRHTFCSRLAMAGAPALAIKELAGHTTLATTMRYMHLSPAAKSAAIELLDHEKLGDIEETAQRSERNP